MDVTIDNKPTLLPTGPQTWVDLLNLPKRRKPVVRRQVTRMLGDLNIHIRQATAAAKDIIRLFENGDEEQAYAQLVELLDSVRILFTVFSSNLGWVETPEAEISQEEFSSTLQRVLAQLIRAKENRFGVAICDTLEFDIMPLLESWQKIAERTHAEVN